MYKQIYDKLCSGNYDFKLSETEIHHIVPKYLGGTNDDYNLIELDVNQHKIAHWLLWKIFGNLQDKLVWYLRSGKYLESIEIRKELQSKYFDELNIKRAQECKKLFESAELPKLKQYREFKRENKFIDKRIYVVDKSKIRKKRENCKQVFMFSLDGKFITTFDSVYSAAEALKFNSVGNIHSAASGNRNTAANYRWSFSKVPNKIKSKKRVYKKTGKQKNPSGHKCYTLVQIHQYDKNNNLLKTWNSRKEISEHLNISIGMMNHVLNGNGSNEYRGFIWKKGKRIRVVEYPDNTIKELKK